MNFDIDKQVLDSFRKYMHMCLGDIVRDTLEHVGKVMSGAIEGMQFERLVVVALKALGQTLESMSKLKYFEAQPSCEELSAIDFWQVLCNAPWKLLAPTMASSAVELSDLEDIAPVAARMNNYLAQLPQFITMDKEVASAGPSMLHNRCMRAGDRLPTNPARAALPAAWPHACVCPHARKPMRPQYARSRMRMSAAGLRAHLPASSISEKP